MEWNLDMGPNTIFFLPQWNGPWLLLDPGIELQSFRSLLGNVDSRKLLFWKDMGEKQWIPLDTAVLSVNRGLFCCCCFCLFLFLFFNHSEAAAHICSHKFAVSGPVTGRFLTTIPILGHLKSVCCDCDYKAWQIPV